jgi:phage tail-like protein
VADTAVGRTDPFRAYNFKLQIQGVVEGHFTECSPLGARVVPVPYRAGGDGRVVRQLAGPVEYDPVTLRYGLTKSSDLWKWFLDSLRGVPRKQNVSILLLGADGVEEVMRWDLESAWPCEWRGSPLDALGKQLAIESFTLVFEGLSRSA